MTPSLIYSASLSLALTFLCICRADLIQKVCSQTKNPPLCKQTLISEPRYRGADLRVLGDISIDKSLPATQVVRDIAVKYGTKECMELADSAVNELKECRGLLKTAHDAFDITTLKSIAADANIDLETCADDYGNELKPELKRAIGLAKDLIEVLMAIVHLL